MSKLNVPILESGDRLSRDEFHRRYCELPNTHAELIEGVVYVRSPARFALHGQPHGLVAGWAATYVSRHPELQYGIESTVYLDPASEVQPDVILFRVPAPPGGARLRDDGYVEGAPQLIVEVAASSASYDLHDKLRVYEQAEVQEYIVWRTVDEALDWFRLQDGAFVRVEPNAEGIIESTAFPGLRLHVAKLLAGDTAGVLAALG
ncbi:MAG TPA: Uma2 family endonuclease [Dehalococcoidia bacterium]|jgi:Uma2 family endonuclease|nr:Uma2 family endonuclease [Dehalococcoidia bacterium]